MPLVQIKGVQGYLSPDQKRDLIEKVTNAVVAVEGEGLRGVTWVLIEDVPDGQWGVGGRIADAAMLRSLAGRSEPCTTTDESARNR